VSNGAALEAARRVATMVEMIETFILGFKMKILIRENGIFNTFSFFS